MRTAFLFLLFVNVARGQLNYDHISGRIMESLALSKGERVILRYDPGYFSELIAPLEKRIAGAGAVVAGKLEYLDRPKTDGGRLAELLKSADVYLWLPLRTAVRYVSPGEQQALVQWLDQGGAHREIHFHWSEGSVLADGLPTAHPPEFDRLYEDALDIDYAALSGLQDRVIAALRLGTIRVRTPAGTNLTFRTMDRPANKQDGDASARRMRSARVRVDREIELPAGVVRIAPDEGSVAGRMVIPEARFGNVVARNIRLQFAGGRVTRIEAGENRDAVGAALKAGGPAAFRFREIGVGVNPKLAVPPGSKVLPYYGYGNAVLRMSLGDNEELGGAVRGSFRRWFFFPDASISSDSDFIVKDGKLSLQ
jgi:hypothetical protein